MMQLRVISESEEHAKLISKIYGVDIVIKFYIQIARLSRLRRQDTAHRVCRLNDFHKKSNERVNDFSRSAYFEHKCLPSSFRSALVFLFLRCRCGTTCPTISRSADGRSRRRRLAVDPVAANGPDQDSV